MVWKGVCLIIPASFVAWIIFLKCNPDDRFNDFFWEPKLFMSSRVTLVIYNIKVWLVMLMFLSIKNHVIRPYLNQQMIGFIVILHIWQCHLLLPPHSHAPGIWIEYLLSTAIKLWRIAFILQEAMVFWRYRNSVLWSYCNGKIPCKQLRGGRMQLVPDFRCVIKRLMS